MNVFLFVLFFFFFSLEGNVADTALTLHLRN